MLGPPSVRKFRLVELPPGMRVAITMYYPRQIAVVLVYTEAITLKISLII